MLFVKKATLLTTEEVYQLEISPEILNSGDPEKIEKEKAKLEFNRTGLFQKKMYVAPNKRSKQIRNNANNIRMMRYAEILLIYAEAAAETADEVAAKMALNQVRLRAGLSEVISTGDALKEAIFNERRLELAGESERYHDLIRTGRANATILPGWSEAKKYWPVPQTEIDNTTGEIEQNSGYNN
ncbi:RagB/SusD family nutrient uptake outer membrane protein [Capnocytophaga canimorsus]|nr:RagB/SusD family nutrient uptake outer membrane protein [Capnocytophaga canimorsus]WGU68869.1 RagB/SusD family nutrient uptake outer membrane protein [Capnocytophaga canimorsus]